MQIELKNYGADLTVKADSASIGTFKGYASTFGNIDRDDDVMMSGAFGSDIPTIGKEAVKLLWQHNRAEPIGRWTKLVEDSKGLYAEGQLALKTRRGAEAYELMKMGALSDMSVGFRTLKSDFAKSGGTPTVEARKVRRIIKTKLYEISLVTIPANAEATVDAVKSARTRMGRAHDADQAKGGIDMMTERDLERRLRDGGLTRKQAATLVAEGLGGWSDGFEDLLREAMGLTRKQATVLINDGFDGLMEHLTCVVKDAASVSCKSTQIIVDKGYKHFVASHTGSDISDGSADADRLTDPLDDLPEFVAAASSAPTDLAKAASLADDAVDKGASDRDDGVHLRDADAGDVSLGTSLAIEADFFKSLVADLGTISGARPS